MIKHPCVGGRYGENHEGEPGEDRERRGDVLKALHCLLHLLAKTSSVTNSWTIAEAATGRELVYNHTIRAAYPRGVASKVRTSNSGTGLLARPI